MTIDRRTLAARITQGRGTSPADLVIKNVRLFDLVTGALIPTDIAICGPTIVGTYGEYRGAREIAGRARIAVPGLIDSHVHVESSLLSGCEQETDKQRFKGDPHDPIVFDEGTDFLESQYRFIIGWNRSTDPKQRCRVIVASNPPTYTPGTYRFLPARLRIARLHPFRDDAQLPRLVLRFSGVDPL